MLIGEQLYRCEFEQFVSENTCILYQADRSKGSEYMGGQVVQIPLFVWKESCENGIGSRIAWLLIWLIQYCSRFGYQLIWERGSERNEC